jgi:NCS2 family nucleobase:cation symporter-2
MLCSALKTVGDITTCQKINDTEWKRPDMKNISKGILADAVGDIASGALGGTGQSTSSSNVGLSIATGATSRVIGYAAGILLIFLAFIPKLSSLFAIMPKPVIGATLFFALSFMIIAGIQIIMSRMIDARKTFVVGISIIFGLTVDIIPEVFDNVNPWIKPIFSSSLATSTIFAVLLNLLFRLGIRKKVQLEVVPGVDTSEKIFTFMDRQGGLWGARKEVISQATAAMNELMEAISEHKLTQTNVTMEVSFDEYNLDVDIHYPGTPIEFPAERPDIEKLLGDSQVALKFSGFLIKQYADKISTQMKNGQCYIRLHFIH